MECRANIDDPEARFDIACTPHEFVSLEAKLNVALRRALGDMKDRTLFQKIQREDQLRYDRGQGGLGGRRVLFETVCFYQLSEDVLQQRALQEFWNLQWIGDNYEQLVSFQGTVHRVTESAHRCGITNGQIVTKLSELLRASAKLQPAFHAYEQAASLNRAF